MFHKEILITLTRSLLISASFVCLLPLAAMAQADAPPAAPAPAIAAAPAAPAAAGAIPAPAAMPATAGQHAVTREEIPALVKETLLNDPEIIMEAAKKYHDKQTADAGKQAVAALEKHKDDLFNNPADPSAGNTKNPDVTVVEFFDYHCGYCRQQLASITKLIGEDKKVRLVFKEFPILSEDSATAARAALAVNAIAKDKYFDFHTALMKHEGKFDEKSLLEIAKKQGINADKLKAEMGKPEITAMLDKNRSMAEELSIHGTPALIIGHQFNPGAMSYDDIKKAVDSARNDKMAAATPAEAPAAAPMAVHDVAPAAAPGAPAAIPVPAKN